MRKFFLFLFFIVLLPISNINAFYKINTCKSGFVSNKNDKKDVIVRILNNNNEIISLPLEEYLVGVVSSEVPVSFEEEALKAQAVAARTYALKQISNNKGNDYDLKTDTSSQVYKTNEELKDIWKEEYDNNIKIIKNAVDKTKGEYITYNNEVIYAFFFSTSNGYTEDNKNVFGEDLPYLKQVDSSFDSEETDNFFFEKNFSLNDFYNLLGINYSDSLTVENIIKSDSDRVLSLKINNTEFKGRDFQKKLSLRSNDFEIHKENNNVRIVTKGFGHGVGMSQYGANALAKRKKSYKEILKYYYTGTSIQKL